MLEESVAIVVGHGKDRLNVLLLLREHVSSARDASLPLRVIERGTGSGAEPDADKAGDD